MPVGIYPRKTLKERFWAKVQRTKTCWIWLGFCNRKTGYGQIGVDGTPQLVHRLSYEWAYGVKLPLGHIVEIDHLCRNPLCVNPNHLELVTHRENVLRGINACATNARVTHCPKGHPYDLFNTYRRPDGGRDCKICQRVRDNKYRLSRVGVTSRV